MGTQLAIANKNFVFAKDVKSLEEIVRQIKVYKKFAIYLIADKDDALDSNILGFAVTYISEEGQYCLYKNVNSSIIKELFEDESLTIIGFDLKFIFKILLAHNIRIKQNI